MGSLRDEVRAGFGLSVDLSGDCHTIVHHSSQSGGSEGWITRNRTCDKLRLRPAEHTWETKAVLRQVVGADRGHRVDHRIKSWQGWLRVCACGFACVP